MPSSSCLPLPPPPPPRHSRHSSPLPSSLPDKYREEEEGRGEKPSPPPREGRIPVPLLRPDAFAQKGREEGLSRHSSAQEEGRKRIAILLPFPPSPDEGRGKSHIFCHLRLPPRPKVFPHTAAPIPLFPPAKFIAETRGGERWEGRLVDPFPRKKNNTPWNMRHIFFCQHSRSRFR